MTDNETIARFIGQPVWWCEGCDGEWYDKPNGHIRGLPLAEECGPLLRIGKAYDQSLDALLPVLEKMELVACAVLLDGDKWDVTLTRRHPANYLAAYSGVGEALPAAAACATAAAIEAMGERA